MKRVQYIGCLFLVAVLCSGLFPPATKACTTFCLFHGQEKIFGRNYDYGIGFGLVLVNKRQVTKSAMPEPPVNVLHWTSKYGSVTFNQFGRDFPMGGINEAGLVVELMALDATVYPAADSRPALDCLEWIQYQLDNFASVKEILQRASEVRIASSVGCHYLIADRNGETASLEYLGGQLVTHTGEALPVKTLTNSTYAESVEHLKKHQGFGGSAPISSSLRSLDRFARASALVKNYQPTPGQSVIDYAFGILKSVSEPAHTKWSIVYDLKKMDVYFRTSRAARVRQFNLKSFDFSCASPVKMLDVNADLEGDVAASFTAYTLAANRKLIESSFSGVNFLRNVPASEREAIARQPEKGSCQSLLMDKASSPRIKK